jgi:hypothetical protein
MMTPTNLITAFDSAESQTISSGMTASTSIERKRDGGDRDTTREANSEEEQLAGEEEGETEEEESPIGDMPGATIDTVDQMMDNIFGDHVHHNDGSHLDGDIADNASWSEYCIRLVVFQARCKICLKGK